MTDWVVGGVFVGVCYFDGSFFIVIASASEAIQCGTFCEGWIATALWASQ
jgi:hypothetical protein